MGVKKTRELNTGKIVKDMSTATASLVKFSSALDTTSSSANNAAKSIDKLSGAASLFSIKTLTKGVAKLVSTFGKFSQSAVDYIEDLNLLKVAFGETADEAFALTKNIANITGFDEATLTRNLGTFRNLTSTLGAANEVADLLATNLEKMSIDISSLYNVDLDRSAYALTGMLTGQPRTIKTLTGANITQSALQQDLSAMGINRTVKELNKAEKAILSYISLEKQLMQSNGDMARTIEQPAQLLRVFREQVSKAARSIGGLLIPVIKSVIPYLTAFLMTFNEIVGTLLTFLGIDVDSFWADMTAGAKATSNGIGIVTKAAEKAHRSLRNFDKLNVITTPTSSGSTGGSGVGGELGIDSRILDALNEYNLHLDNIKTKATTIRDRIMDWLGFTKLINENGELIGWKYEGIGKTVENIYKSWKDLNLIFKLIISYGLIKLFKNLGTQLGKVGTILTKKVITKFETLYGVFKQINSGKYGFETLINNFYATKTTAEKVGIAFQGLATFAGGIFTVATGLDDIMENGLNVINTIEILIGTIMSIIGALELVSAAASIFGTTMSAHMAVATGGVTLAFEALILLVEWFKKSKDKVDENEEATKKYREELERLEDQIKNKMKATYGQADRAEELTQKLEKLVDQNGKVRGAEEEVKVIFEELNELLGTNYEIVGDSITQDGKKIKSREQLVSITQQYIDKLKAENLIEYSKEKTNKLYERNVELKKQIKEKEDELKKSLEESQKADDFSYESWAKNNKSKITKLEELNNELLQNGKELDNYYQAIVKAGDGNYKEAEKLIIQSVEGTKISINDMMNTLTESVDNTLASINWNAIINGAKTSGSSAGKNFAQNYVNSANKEFSKNGISLQSTEPLWASVKQKAEGGFVDSGEIYLARENGLSEYIGRVGHKTAVANNDQIVQGITQGVTNAIISTGGLNSRPIVIKADGDTNGLMNFIRFKQQEDNMQYGN